MDELRQSDSADSALSAPGQETDRLMRTSTSGGGAGDGKGAGAHVVQTTASRFSDAGAGPAGDIDYGDGAEGRAVQYKVYKRRWFGLCQLILLNIVVSWDWLTFAAVSKTTSHFFAVSETAVNWLTIAFLFAFVAISPLTIYMLDRGPKPSMVVASCLLLAGNWIRFAGARATTYHRNGGGGRSYFAVVVFGQMLNGFAQPFVLAAPTTYSDLWFTERGRVTATAVASLANPFGGAIGQLVSPMFASKAKQIPNMVLYIAIISSVAALPSFFLPTAPPTPPSAITSTSSTTSKPINLVHQLRLLSHSLSSWLLLLPFATYVGFFNAYSALISQIYTPYSFSETASGLVGALLIGVGLLAAALTSPLIDRTHAFLPAIRILVPLLALTYLSIIWAPPTRSLPAPFILSALLGAFSFALVPVALELAVDVTGPLGVGPGVSSTVFWAGGQLLGGVFTIVMGALRGGVEGEPEDTMERALVFQAVVAMVVAPVPLVLGVRRWGLGVGGRGGDGNGRSGRSAGLTEDGRREGGVVDDEEVRPRVERGGVSGIALGGR